MLSDDGPGLLGSGSATKTLPAEGRGDGGGGTVAREQDLHASGHSGRSQVSVSTARRAAPGPPPRLRLSPRLGVAGRGFVSTQASALPNAKAAPKGAALWLQMIQQ